MRAVLSVVLVILVSIGWGEVAAQQTPAPAAPPAAPTPPEPKAGNGIDGFRSARFGMTEAQVRAAIREDFKIADAAMKAATHPLEQTRSLSITVRDLIPNSGDAQVAYVFGFRSKTLIQVNILWNASDPAGTEIVIGVGNALRDYFIGQIDRFVKDQAKANVQLPDGRILLFQGADEKGRAVELVMVVAARPPVKGQPADPRPASAQLRLLYVLAPGNSDIQRLQPGQF